MAEEGICPKHKSQSFTEQKQVPDELLNPASGILVKILHRLLYELRTLYLKVRPTFIFLKNTMQEASYFHNIYDITYFDISIFRSI